MGTKLVTCLVLSLAVFGCKTSQHILDSWSGAKVGDSVVIEVTDALTLLAGPAGQTAARSVCWIRPGDKLIIVKIVGHSAAVLYEQNEINRGDSLYCDPGSFLKVSYVGWHDYLQAHERLAAEQEENRRLLEGIGQPAEKE